MPVAANGLNRDPLIQWVSTNQDFSAAAKPNTDQESVRHLYLPHPTLVGNFLVLFVRHDSSLTGCTIKDDTNTTWGEITNRTDAGTGTTVRAFCRPFNPGGIKRIDATPTTPAGTGWQFASFDYGEFATVINATLGSGNLILNNPVAGGTSTAWTTGLQAPVTEDICLLWGSTGDNGPYGKFTVDQPNVYQFLSADTVRGKAAVYAYRKFIGVNPPTINATLNQSWQVIQLKIARDLSVGNFPSPNEPRIIRAMWADVDDVVNTTFHVQMPSTGNFLLLANQLNDDPATGITTLADDAGNHWQRTLSDIASGAGYVWWQWPGQGHMTGGPNGLYITFTCAATFAQDTVLFYDCYFPGGAELGGFNMLHGNDAVGGGTVTTAALTPAVPGGIAFFQIGINVGTIADMVDNATFLLDHPWAPEYDGGENVVAEDQGWCHAFVTDAGKTLTPVWNTTHGEPILGWSSSAIYFYARAQAMRHGGHSQTPALRRA